MERSPVTEYQELSALYEEADGLDGEACEAMLARLRDAKHPLVVALEQMLRARDRVRTGSFLDRLPRIQPAPDRAADAGFSAGDHFGPYSLVRRLGRGGMAQVWLADRDDGAFQRHVAIKLPYRHAEGAQRETLVQRFARERDILAALHHPNIAALHDAGVTPAGQPWLALEFVEGEAITAWCDRQRLGVRARVRLFRQVLRAVQHAHANLVIHRDLKPANILVTPQGNVRLLDFGIAKLIEPVGSGAADSELTRAGGTPLTLLYASPEQIAGRPLTTACDVYSLGVVLYELLCGERPYELKVDTTAQIEQAIVEQEPRAPSRRTLGAEVLAARNADARSLRRELAPDLDAIVLRALAKRPDGRYASVEALLADLDRWLGGQTVSARKPSAWYRWGKFAGRNRVGVGLGAAAVASLVGVATVAVVMGLQAKQESARAVAARDFLLDMFKQVDPELHGGKDVPAQALLVAGEEKASKELHGQPLLQAEVLKGIGDVQMFLGDYARARSALGQVLRIRLQSGDNQGAAQTALDLADIAMRMGDQDEALQRAEEAQRLRRPAEDDHAFLARYWWVRGWVAGHQRVDPIERARAAELAWRHAQQAFGPGDRLTIDAKRQVADVHATKGEHTRALELLREAERQMLALPTFNRRDHLTVRFELANVEFAAGLFATAAADMGRALADCERAIGPEAEECGVIRIRHVVFLLGLGARAEAARHLPALVRQTEQATSPRRQAEAQTLALRLAAHAGQLEQFPKLRQDVVRLGESGTEVRQYGTIKASALLYLAEAELLRGDTAAAQRWIDHLRRRARGDIPLEARNAGRLNLLQGIARQMQGDHGAALVAFDAARTDYAAALRADSTALTIFMLNRARSLHALGRTNEALELVRASLPLLRQRMGDDAPMFQAAAALEAEFVPGSTGRAGRDDRILFFI